MFPFIGLKNITALLTQCKCTCVLAVPYIKERGMTPKPTPFHPGWGIVYYISIFYSTSCQFFISIIQASDKIDIMVLELQEIKREITEVESKLDDLMATDTTQLYFNVDSMKKLTEVREWQYDEEFLTPWVVVTLFLLVDLTCIMCHRHCPCYERAVTTFPQHTCSSCGFKSLVYQNNNKFWQNLAELKPVFDLVC